MYRLVIATIVALFATPLAGGPAFARVIAIWKLRPPLEAGGQPRRVKAYGSGFIIDPSGIIVTNRHVIDGALDIKVIFDNGDRVNGKLVAIRADDRPRGGEGGSRPSAAGAEMGRQRRPPGG